MLKSVQIIAPGRRLFLTAAFGLAILSTAFFFARTAEAQEAGDAVIEARTPLTPAELEELVGPIALYPDDLISIVLPASTFPLQIVQADRYLKAHENDPKLKPNENWDDSVVALLNYPEVIELMNDDLDWTRELGEAAVYQQTALLDAIQEFRDRAYAAGNLKSDDRQVVTKNEEVIVIEPADPKVIYVPVYEPEYVIVRHIYPVYRYYPRSYPVYYYPYPYGYSFGSSFFWGVTLAFAIDWHAHHVHVRHHHHYAHPYYGHYYHYPFYRRYTVRVSYREDIWRPRHYRHFRQRHAAARVKANSRIDAALANRERHRAHSDWRQRRSAPESRGDLRHRRPGFDSDKHVSRSADHRRNQAALGHRVVTRPGHQSRRGSGIASRSPKKYLETRTRHPGAVTGAMRNKRPGQEHAQPSTKFKRVPSNPSSRSEFRRGIVPMHRNPPKAAPRRSAPRHDRLFADPSHRAKYLGGFATRSAPGPRPHSSENFGPSTRSGAGPGAGSRFRLSNRHGGYRFGAHGRLGPNRSGWRN